MSYKVTVIIPSYNSIEFLDETIESIINQTIGFENIELIIVDDLSTDNTQEVINSYVEKYENIKTYKNTKKTGTPGRARNIAISHAEADYIMFIDHDDKYLPNTVENLYNAITKNSSDVAIGKFQNFGQNNIISDGWITEDVILNSIDENKLFFSINNIWRMIFPKEFLNKNNITFPEGVFAEDLAFMIDVFVNASKIVFINEIVYNFRLRTGDNSSTSLSKGIHYLNGLIKGYDDVAEVLEKNNAPQYYDTIFNQHLSCWLSDLCLSETIDFNTKKDLIKKSNHLFNKIENVKPFPENQAIENMIIAINENNLDDVYNQMKNYKKTSEKTIRKQKTKNKIKSLKNRLFN